MQQVQIIAYQPAYAAAFKSLNIAWLQKYFVVEPIDEEVLSHPEQYILANGGNIYFAILDQQPIGCFALMKHNQHTFELTKMAVHESMQGKGVGQLLLQHSFIAAKDLGATNLILYSNTKLAAAIHLYKKHGFATINLESSVYKRADIKMEKQLS